MVGIIIGTYSSIFVASPVLLWMSKADQTKAAPTGQSRTQARPTPWASRLSELVLSCSMRKVSATGAGLPVRDVRAA